ncbi:MAG: hypothetical protein NTV51_25140 [Verrucomicrobia bacterium]|nr:hypothetical protein [Verrucomicrobiota bacterium]
MVVSQSNLPMRHFLRLVILLGLLTAGRAAPALAVVQGSTSPDGRLALAYVPLKSGVSFEDEDEVYLVEFKSMRIVQQVPGCFSSGGSWGERSTNVKGEWHPSGRYLVVNFRCGRMLGEGLLFKVAAGRLTQIPLPPLTSHPKSKILEILVQNSNSGTELSWDNASQLRCYNWGYVPKEGHGGDDEYANYGLPGFADVIQFVFEFKLNGSLRLIDLQTSGRKT